MTEMDYIERMRKKFDDRVKLKKVAVDMLQSNEFSAAKEILQHLLALYEESEERLEVLLQIAECDLMLHDKISPETDREITQALDVYQSYQVVEENAKQHNDVGTVVMTWYAWKMAKQQQTPDKALLQIEKYMSTMQSTILSLAKSANTRKSAHKITSIMRLMIMEMKEITTAERELMGATQGSCYNKIGYLYNELARHRSAKPFLEAGIAAMDKYLKSGAVKYHIYASLHNNIGCCYSEEGEHADAARHFGKAYKSMKEARDATGERKQEWLPKYKELYKKHLSDPSVDPADVVKICEEITSRTNVTKITKEDTEAESEKPTTEEVYSQKTNGANNAGSHRGSFVYIGNGIHVNHNECVQEDYCIFIGKLNEKEVAVKRGEFLKKHAEKLSDLTKLTKHPNVVEYLGYYEIEAPDMPGVKYIYVAMELCCKDSLHEMAKDDNFPFQRRTSSLLQLMLGLSQLHANGIVHGDLKPCDVLLSSDGRHFKISALTMSPESAEMPLGEERSESIDIYSAGIIFFYVLTSGKFIGNIDLEDLNCPDADIVGDLIDAMLQMSPHDRPNAYQVLTHPFFWDKCRRLKFICDIVECITTSPEEKANKIICDLDSCIRSIVDDHWQELSKDTDGGEEVKDADTDATQQVPHSDAKNSCSGVPAEYDGPFKLLILISTKYRTIENTEDSQLRAEKIETLWEFVASRFPKLYPKIYRFIQSHVRAAGDRENESPINWSAVAYYYQPHSKVPLDPEWRSDKIVTFLNMVALEDELEKLYADSGHDVFGKDWMTQLALTKAERKDLRKEIAEKGSKLKVEKWAIFNRADAPGPNEVKYDELSLRSLLMYIAYLYVHFEEEKNQIKFVFGNDRSQIWPFFSDRFPILFDEVRKRVCDSSWYGCIIADVICSQ